MKIERHPKFKQSFKKRIEPDQKLLLKTLKRLSLFGSNPSHPLLRDHALVGKMKEYRAFSITGDIRVVYKKLSTNHIVLIDIGTHNQVY